MIKRTKIIATIGPASDKKNIIKQLIKEGLDVARLNFSHNTHVYHARTIKTLRAAAKEMKSPLAIIADLQGPRIRLGDLPAAGVAVKTREKIILTTGAAGKNNISVTYKNLHSDVRPGERILIADGLIELEIKRVSGRDIHCAVKTGGKLLSHKGLNLPDSNLSLSALTVKDKKDLALAVAGGVDFVALSFARDEKDVKNLRRLIVSAAKKVKLRDQLPGIIVKVERREAVENIERIVEETDAIMVARGDLGIELPAARVPIIQKQIIEKCLAARKPVIVATQMLESMIANPRPTRAEASDVANAVIDHTDAVMLSGETATGKYPLAAVTTMRQIIEATEKSSYDDLPLLEACAHESAAMAGAARLLAEKTGARFILAGTLSGATGRVISSFRPELPVYLGAPNERVARQLNLSWGIWPFVMPRCQTLREMVSKAVAYLKKNKLARRGDKMIVLAGLPLGARKQTAIVEVGVIDD